MAERRSDRGGSCSGALRRPALALVLAAAPLWGGCAVRFESQEVFIRHDAAADAIDLFIIYRGVAASEEKEERAQQAADLVEKLAGGARAFWIPNLFITCDVDEEATKLRGRAVEPDSAEAARAREETLAVLDGIRLLHVEVFVEPDGRLGGCQRFRIAGAARAVAVLNRGINEALGAAMADAGKFAADTPLLDERTRELWKAHVAAGKPWIRLEAGRFEISAPMTAETATRVRSTLVEQLSVDEEQGSAAFLGRVLVHLVAFESGADRWRLELAPSASGVFRLATGSDGGRYDPRLVEVLRSRGRRFPQRTVDEVRARFIDPASGAVKPAGKE